MDSFTKKAVMAMVAMVAVQSLQATLITGTIGFGGDVTWNSSSAATATQVTGWLDTQVISDSGSFASFITPIAPATFTTATWNLSDPSTIIPSFWQAGGFTFTLDSSQVVARGGTPGVNGFVVVDGMGTVSGNDLETTVMTWSFTAQDPQTGSAPAQWTFSASANSVPDGGATAMLMGIALSGIAVLKKKLKA